MTQTQIKNWDVKPDNVAEFDVVIDPQIANMRGVALELIKGKGTGFGYSAENGSEPNVIHVTSLKQLDQETAKRQILGFLGE